MSEIINYSGRLDELREGTVIRNGEGGTTCHFVKADNDRWYPSDVTGKETGAYPAGHASSRVFLPAAVVDHAEATMQLAANVAAEVLGDMDVYDHTDPTGHQVAERIARRLSEANLLRTN
ncbi:hypothetical protein J1763_gp80 [Gordonia phage YorkOnyx]|uniref:Uncharacterized protein n=1 Tax=Gordonia phage YorkOnyx TaxID=2762402 RepID=A0A7G8LMC9_9CAUD|nr:hypothetical protein J1763_gp80 [Gordonia phage YorkOnyx]QNJ58401.1 hypothetical protein SEA_YORKONYX_80 [Gordonia phage YorkOnyx]